MITTAFLAPPFGAARTAVFLRYRSPRHPRRQFRRLRRSAVARVQAGDTHIRDAAGQPSGQRKCGRQTKSVGMGHVSTPPPQYNPTSLLVSKSVRDACVGLTLFEIRKRQNRDIRSYARLGAMREGCETGDWQVMTRGGSVASACAAY
jgi:hypothetical protein